MNKKAVVSYKAANKFGRVEGKAWLLRLAISRIIRKEAPKGDNTTGY